MTNLRQAALDYNAMGWPIFRLQPQGKTPIGGTRGRDDATTDTILINRWWTELPTLNIGLATGAESRIFVLDADPKKGGDKSLQQLLSEHGPLPRTRIAITGSLGTHHYFLMRGDVRNSASLIAPGIDIRGNGGYVVLPPSEHPDFTPPRFYHWAPDSADEIAEAPEWLLKLIAEKQPVDSNGKRKGKPLEEWHRTLTSPIVDGTRNETIASICGKLLHCGVHDPVLMLDLLRCVDTARCQPPLGEREVTQVMRSIWIKHFEAKRRDGYAG
jgi:Bifunctional DNA primase/polymerase, N-terminal/Primase C terminal 1 (PriCT-1)